MTRQNICQKQVSTTLSPKTTYKQDGTKDGKYTGLQGAVHVETTQEEMPAAWHEGDASEGQTSLKARPVTAAKKGPTSHTDEGCSATYWGTDCPPCAKELH